MSPCPIPEGGDHQGGSQQGTATKGTAWRHRGQKTRSLASALTSESGPAQRRRALYARRCLGRCSGQWIAHPVSTLTSQQPCKGHSSESGGGNFEQEKPSGSSCLQSGTTARQVTHTKIKPFKAHPNTDVDSRPSPEEKEAHLDPGESGAVRERGQVI